ncbi:hypothetical protein [Sulfurisoma sediminicola]|uniref:PilZ domain-containing protein n=1 Tax=Sulfurisoma sediminicola TaxID=1381557 RepID=A0A497XB62_9PROT|nr:hypothetical protein [Sulfurisoma sediminicola]RLJ62856.1 hypothetical protein DFR35_2677 [Sulfurisoma sediminicola]
MLERRAHPRYQLIPPLRGRAFIDAIGQFEAQLLDVSVDGVRLLLHMSNPDDLARFLVATEKSITATFGRPEGEPWKFALLHTRMTTLDAAGSAGAQCLIASRFVTVPNFTVADLERLVAERQAARV